MVCCQRDGELCSMCTGAMLKPVMVEVGYTYRMKRQFEQLLEKRIDQTIEADRMVETGQQKSQNKKGSGGVDPGVRQMYRLQVQEKIKMMQRRI